MKLLLLGPKTRLAQTFMAQWCRTDELLLMARGSSEAEALQRQCPGVRVIGPSCTEGPIDGTLLVLAFALGPVHRSNSVQEDARRLVAEFEGLLSRLAVWSPSQLHVLLVSSVLAMVPRVESYGSCKLLAESLLSEHLKLRSESSLSVLYPGRLVERREARCPSTLIATRYDDLAKTICMWAQRPRPVRRVIGLDARLLLWKTALHQMVSGLPEHARCSCNETGANGNAARMNVQPEPIGCDIQKE